MINSYNAISVTFWVGGKRIDRMGDDSLWPWRFKARERVR